MIAKERFQKKKKKKRSKNNKKQVKTKKIASEIRFGLLKKIG